MVRARFASPPALIALTIILSIALFTRFSGLPEKNVFFGDVGRTMLAGRNILLGQSVLTGPLTSIPGFHLGPLYYYLTAFSLKLSSFDPIGPAIMVSSFGVGAVILLYIYLKRWWGNTAALFGSIWFACSPLVMLQSRIPIEPSPLPFFTLLWLIFTARFFETRRVGWMIGSALSIAISVQLNFSAIMLVPITFFSWIASETRLPAKHRRNFLVLSMLGLSMLTIARVLWRPSTTLSYFWTVWQQLTFPQLHSISSLVFVFFLASIWLVNKGEIGKNLKLGHRTLLYLWAFIALLGFLLKTVNGQHALGLLFPYPFIYLGIGWQYATSRWKKLAGTLATVLFCSFLAWQAYGVLQNWQGNMIGEAQVITNEILDRSQGEPYAFLYRGHLDVYDAADDHIQYLLWWKGNPPVDAARIEFYQETREQWLLSTPTNFIPRVITLFVPAPPQQGFSLEVVEK